MRDWGQAVAIRAAGNGPLGGRVLLREILFISSTWWGWVGWQVGFSTKPRYPPLQLVRLLLHPLSILLFIEAQCLLRPLQYGRVSLTFCT